MESRESPRDATHYLPLRSEWEDREQVRTKSRGGCRRGEDVEEGKM